jgi:MYXO-CTERM domain-containing protein
VFGLDLSGDTLVMGAPLRDTANGVNSGAAFVFTRSGATWTEKAELAPMGATDESRFASPVQVSGDTVVGGAWPHDASGLTDAGAAWVFILRRSDGEPCAGAAQCLSGNCVEGVCCDQACDGDPCRACSKAQGAPADGTCAIAPGKACDDGDQCSQIDACDEAGACAGAKPVVCSSEDACQLPGTCDPKTGACAPPTGEVCSSGENNGSAPSVPSAVTLCATGSECESGFCADGVCCDSACDAPCHSCVLFPIIGKCTRAPAGVDLRHDCYPVVNCLRTCGGNGQCIGAGPGVLCLPPRCNGRSAGLGPAYCPDLGAECPSDASVPFDCSPYACIEAFGACRSDCRTNDDCAEGYACDIDGSCVTPPAPDAASGCGVTVEGQSGGDSWAGWLLALAALLGARQRRTGRRSA